MEIDRLRKELNELLINVVKHSQQYNDNRPIPSLEISFILSKINKMQEHLIVLKYLLENQENNIKNNDDELLGLDNHQEEFHPENEEINKKQGNEKIENIIYNSSSEPEKKHLNLEKLPISSITDVITLNDRYLFANELFNKDMAAFNESIKTFDNCNSFDEAKAMYDEFTMQYQWDEENEQVIYFFNLIERRFL